jgi:hypothetical protein
MTILTSTLADLTAAKLTSYYAKPLEGVPIVQPSTDPTVYVQDPNYIKNLNKQAYQKYAVDVPNQYEADRFNFRAKQWEANKSATNIPKPSFLIFDSDAFDRWWTILNLTYTDGSPTRGDNAPPLFFVKPALLPPDPVILAAGAPPPPPPATDGPIGSPVPFNPGVFNPSATDTFPDGYVYAGVTGIYQKHVYSNPFTAGNVRIIWIGLQLTPALPVAA